MNGNGSNSDQETDALARESGGDGEGEPSPARGPNGETGPGPDDVAALKRERDSFRDQVLRARAEFANYQKRAKQQADADRAYAVGSLARDLLDSIDNLARAVDALRSNVSEGITSGLDMVQKQLLDTLAKHGVEPIGALGQPFDPNLHDAIVRQPSLDHPEGTVVAELGKGYKIRDRVLRPSKVAVAVTPSDRDGS
jgi:molecular chaperone GrpE